MGTEEKVQTSSKNVENSKKRKLLGDQISSKIQMIHSCSDLSWQWKYCGTFSLSSME